MSAGSVRTAIVTGASSGIGAALARAFGALGWRVAIGARRRERLVEVGVDVEKAGGEVFAHPLDVCSPDSIEAFFDALEQTSGPADVVVNNAGASTPGLLHDLSPAELAAEVAVNLTGPLHVARRALLALEGAERGDLVFISSEVVIAPRPWQVAYSASKAGIEAAARALALELEGTGIRVTTVRVGATGSEFAAEWGGAKVKALLEDWHRLGIQRHLAFLTAEHVADAVVRAVTAPPGVQLGIIEVRPEAPKSN